MSGLIGHIGLLLKTAGGPTIPDGGDRERLWAGLALTPGRSDYIDNTNQELIERSWMEISNGIY